MSNGPCPCDQWVHPEVVRIPAGLDWLPRQIAGFPGFRRAMLAELNNHPPLAGWRAREEDDLGVMLIEMWAYVCDVLAFYDQVIANEGYLRTARLRPSLRKLVNLLGYVPRPAVAASVLLAAVAQGRQPVTLPAGTPFRSGAFDDQPPQVFELERETTIHPLNNRWQVAAVGKESVGDGTGDGRRLLLDPGRKNLEEGDVVLLRVPDSNFTTAGSVCSLSEIQGDDGRSYIRVDLTLPNALPNGVAPERFLLQKATQTASLWNLDAEHGNPDDPGAIETLTTTKSEGISDPRDGFGEAGGEAVVESSLTMNGLNREIKAGQYIVLQLRNEFRWFKIRDIREYMMQFIPRQRIHVSGPDVIVPAVRTPATRLFLDALIDDRRHGASERHWGSSLAGQILVHHGFVRAGIVTVDNKPTLAADDAMRLEGAGSARLEWLPPRHLPSQFLVQDKNETAHSVRGTIDPESGIVTADPAEVWSSPLVQPVTIYGNVIEASRGETVRREILGSGDASMAGQSFTLKRKPLTYVSAPTSTDEYGVLSTLTVRVDGILWKEERSFLGAGPDDAVYIVRQTDEGDTVITFGDGRRGRRLSTGRDNVVAGYRFGAGAKAPPAGAITQIAKPVKGLTSVRNPLPAAGGDDAEGPEKLREHGPRSALTLGRAVSIDDFQALAAGCPGVRAVRAEWRWDGVRQGAVVKIWCIGEPGIENKVRETLRFRADPTVTIDVEHAAPEPLKLMLSIQIDPRYGDRDVLDAVRGALMNPETGLLAPENIGIGGPLFRSRIFERVLSVEGALAVVHMSYIEEGYVCSDGMAHAWIRHVSFDDAALNPGAGRYFDLEAGGLSLSPQEQRDG